MIEHEPLVTRPIEKCKHCKHLWHGVKCDKKVRSNVNPFEPVVECDCPTSFVDKYPTQST